MESFFNNNPSEAQIYVRPEKFPQIRDFFKGKDWQNLQRLTSASSLAGLVKSLSNLLKNYLPQVEHFPDLLGTEVNIYKAFLAQLQQLIEELEGQPTFCTTGAEISLLIPNIVTILGKIQLDDEYVINITDIIKNLLNTIDSCNQCNEEIGRVEHIVLRAYQQSIGIALQLNAI